jgi:hypothetical protein
VRYVIAIALLGVQATSTGCYRWTHLEPNSATGNVVRVHLRNHGSVEGRIVRTTEDSLYLQQAHGAENPVRSVPRSEVERVEQRTFSATRSAAYGTALAVGAFAIVAAVMSLAQSQSYNIY